MEMRHIANECNPYRASNTNSRTYTIFGDSAQLTVENISQNQVCARFQVPITGQQT